MVDERNGRTRADDFDVDTILPDLTDLDPDLGDLLDLSGPPPDPLPLAHRAPFSPVSAPSPVSTAGADGRVDHDEPDDDEPSVEVEGAVEVGAPDAPDGDATGELEMHREITEEEQDHSHEPPIVLPLVDDEIPAAALEGPDFIDRIVEAHADHMVEDPGGVDAAWEADPSNPNPPDDDPLTGEIVGLPLAEPDEDKPDEEEPDEEEEDLAGGASVRPTLGDLPPWEPITLPSLDLDLGLGAERSEPPEVDAEAEEPDALQLFTQRIDREPFDTAVIRGDVFEPLASHPFAAPGPSYQEDPPPEGDEVAAPRMPVVPVGEIDGFASQVAGVVADRDPDLLDAAPLDAAPLDAPPETPTAGAFAVRTDLVSAFGEAHDGVPADVEVAPSESAMSPAPDAVDEPAPAVAVPLVDPEPVVPTRATFAPGAPPLASSAPFTTPGPAPCIEPTPVTDIARTAPAWRRHAAKVATVAIALGGVAALLITKPGSGDDQPAPRDESKPAVVPQTDAPVAAPQDHTSFVAEAVIPLIDVYDSPESRDPRLSLEHPTEIGGNLVFLVKEQKDDWLEVFLPTPPAGITGWIKSEQVKLTKHAYSVTINLTSHRLLMTDNGEEKFAADIGVGRRDTPVEGGVFYIKELVEPPNPDTVYGDYAFGLSGFDSSIEQFSAGKGVVGIHGTNDAAPIGKDADSGSIRMRNEDMLELVGVLPLGTPVEIIP